MIIIGRSSTYIMFWLIYYLTVACHYQSAITWLFILSKDYLIQNYQSRHNLDLVTYHL